MTGSVLSTRSAVLATTAERTPEPETATALRWLTPSGRSATDSVLAAAPACRSVSASLHRSVPAHGVTPGAVSIEIA